MNEYQKQIIKKTKHLRPKSNYPTYPSYHKGLYIENLYFDFFKNSKINNEKIYLPIFWTTIYNENILGLQEFLNTLDNKFKYYTVCQHDDAVKEILPINTKVLSAGGNRGDIPIPLVCSPIPNNYLHDNKEKKYSHLLSDH